MNGPWKLLLGRMTWRFRDRMGGWAPPSRLRRAVARLHAYPDYFVRTHSSPLPVLRCFHRFTGR